MAKKKNQPPEPVPSTSPAPQADQPQEDPISNRRIWVFWIGVAVTIILARVLNAMLPGISESLIERWVMLGFAAFLAIFLIKL